jgi:hypothetical protein
VREGSRAAEPVDDSYLLRRTDQPPEKNLPTRLRIAAFYEIAAGLGSLPLFVHVTIDSHSRAIGFNVFALVLAGFSIALGLALWNRVRASVPLSIVWQCTQIPRIATSVVTLRLLVGAECTLLFKGANVQLFFEFGVSMIVTTSRGVVAEGLGINLIALAVVLLMVQHWPASEKQAHVRSRDDIR